MAEGQLNRGAALDRTSQKGGWAQSTKRLRPSSCERSVRGKTTTKRDKMRDRLGGCRDRGTSWLPFVYREHVNMQRQKKVNKHVNLELGVEYNNNGNQQQ